MYTKEKNAKYISSSGEIHIFCIPV